MNRFNSSLNTSHFKKSRPSMNVKKKAYAHTYVLVQRSAETNNKKDKALPLIIASQSPPA